MWKSKVIAEWREEGQAEGLHEGRLEAARGCLMTLLRAWYPDALTPRLVSRIELTDDLDLLRSWFDAALTAPSVKCFWDQTGTAP